MAINRQKQLALRRRREQVAQLYAQSRTQLEIGELLGVSQATISQDLRQLDREWREAAAQNIEQLRQADLKKLANIEREACLAWERSQKPQQAADIRGNGAGNKTRKRLKYQYGDPRFLAIRCQCIAQRRALIGLDAPTKVAPASAEPESPYRQATLPEVENLSPEKFAELQHALEIIERINQGGSNDQTS